MADQHPDQINDAAITLRGTVLTALWHVSEPGWCLNLRGLSDRTGLSREMARGIVADLRAVGLVSHHIGLWTEDGTPGGAGYALTERGRKVAQPLFQNDEAAA